MRIVPVGFTVALVLAVSLAGCAGKSNEQGGDGTPSAPPAVAGQDVGSIHGFVTDDSLLPVQGASVGVRELDLQGLTDAKGEFTFNDVAPGRYTVAVSKLGYESKAKPVDVVAGQVHEVNIQVEPVAALDEAYSVLNITSGRIVCGQGNPVFVDVICGDPLFAVQTNPDQKFLFKYEIEEEAVGQLWEQVWQPTQLLSRDLNFFLEKDGCGLSCPSGDRFASVNGCCYLRVALDDDEMDIGGVEAGSDGATIQSRTFPYGGTVNNPTFNFFLDQTFTIYWEQFFGELPADFETRTNVPPA